jgi:large subunit ribosomal protein L18
MDNLKHKLANRKRRQKRVRSIVSGTEARPRLSVFFSLRHVTAQLVDDVTGRTLVYSTSVGQKKLPANLTEKAKWVGSDIAKKAIAKKYTKVVLDRNGKLYHGRVAALANAARAAGLEI